ncbi:glycosyltransferase family 39 protein [Anaerolineales bacterium HSG24]|nr:glycosyltransferase family 39 protein [Anaerolineales bacterium HSG24]
MNNCLMMTMMTHQVVKVRTTTKYLLPILIIWLAFALRLYRLEAQSIWWDEGHSIFVANHPLTEIATLPAMDVHPPLYFALLHGWMALVGNTEFALRYLSVLFSLLTVVLLWQFARKIRPRSPLVANLTTFLAAISPLYIAYAQEVRSYALLTCLALASSFLQWRLLTHPLLKAYETFSVLKTPLFWGYILVTTASLYTHYFTIFVLLFQNLVWLMWLTLKVSKTLRVSEHQQEGVLWLTSQLSIVMLFLPQLSIATRQVTDYANPNLLPPSLNHFLLHSWQAYTVGLNLDLMMAQWSSQVLGLIFALAAGIFLLHHRWAALYCLGWLFIPLIAYFLILQSRPSFEPRYLMLITPAIFLILGNGLGGILLDNGNLPADKVGRALVCPHTDRLKPILQLWSDLSGLDWLKVGAAFLISLILLVSLNQYYTNQNYFKDNSAGVAQWLAQETTPNDLVFVDVPHPFHYYVDRYNIPAPTRYLFVDVHTAAETLSNEANGKQRMFWLTWYGSDTDPRGVIEFLARKHGEPLGQQEFRGYRGQWFSLPDGPFSLPNQLVPQETQFGEVLQLIGADMGKNRAMLTQLAAHGAVWATLHYQLLQPTPVNYRASLRLRGEDGHIISQLDKDLLNDRHFRTSAWPIADSALNQAINVYLLSIPAETTPGLYQLELVIYNAEPPYPSEGVSGSTTNDGSAAIIGIVTLD